MRKIRRLATVLTGLAVAALLHAAPAEAATYGPYKFINGLNNLCMDVAYGNPANPLEQATCWNGDMQLWAVELS